MTGGSPGAVPHAPPRAVSTNPATGERAPQPTAHTLPRPLHARQPSWAYTLQVALRVRTPRAHSAPLPHDTRPPPTAQARSSSSLGPPTSSRCQWHPPRARSRPRARHRRATSPGSRHRTRRPPRRPCR
eukprot:5724632-Prymnesium_polylepis.1